MCVRHVKKQPSGVQEKLMKDDAHTKVAADFMTMLSMSSVLYHCHQFCYVSYYYYYNHFTAPWTLSGTTPVSRYQKGKTRKVKPIWIYWSKR